MALAGVSSHARRFGASRPYREQPLLGLAPLVLLFSRPAAVARAGAIPVPPVDGAARWNGGRAYQVGSFLLRRLITDSGCRAEAGSGCRCSGFHSVATAVGSIPDGKLPPGTVERSHR